MTGPISRGSPARGEVGRVAEVLDDHAHRVGEAVGVDVALGGLPLEVAPHALGQERARATPC